MTNQYIAANVTITNTEARARNVDVNLNIGELRLRDGDISLLHKNYNVITVGN